MGLHAIGGRAPHIAGSAETADHLIGDQHHVIFLEHRLDLVPIRRGRENRAAGAHHGFGDHRRHGVGTLAEDALLERLSHARGECLFALPGLPESIPVRAIDVQDVRDRQVEIAVIVGKPGEAGARDSHAVIPLHPAQDLFLLRAADRIVVIPDQLDHGIVGLRARVHEEHFRHRHRRDAEKFLCELDPDVVRFGSEGVIVRQLEHLAVGGLRQPALGESKTPSPSVITIGPSVWCSFRLV